MGEVPLSTAARRKPGVNAQSSRDQRFSAREAQPGKVRERFRKGCPERKDRARRQNHTEMVMNQESPIPRVAHRPVVPAGQRCARTPVSIQAEIDFAGRDCRLGLCCGRADRLLLLRHLLLGGTLLETPLSLLALNRLLLMRRAALAL